MDNFNQNNSIDLSSLRKKILTIDDAYDFCLINSKHYIFIPSEYYFPRSKGFIVDFFYQFISGSKRVSFIHISISVDDFNRTLHSYITSLQAIK